MIAQISVDLMFLNGSTDSDLVYFRRQKQSLLLLSASCLFS
jgi:hypothetical protein